MQKLLCIVTVVLNDRSFYTFMDEVYREKLIAGGSVLYKDEEDYSRNGVYSLTLGEASGCSDGRFIMFVKGDSVFKTGGGMNYVRGGASPQEMIILCISVHAQKV